jgi:ABC-type antimicrobial peptide transport system permease subunit
MNLLMFFAALGVIISCIGLYGLLAYIVNCRSPEIGIRIALGAKNIDLVRLLARESLIPVAGGITFGFIGICASARWLENMLFGVASTDPWTISSVAIILMVVAGLAAIGPVRTALNTDCMQRLRSD